ncbi:uncharacterized protein LOC127870084 [Dreissena polymorpha]|uniref:uncharacterized protein LOC127870084 n=1 Tax=Dreissena polymorpha TaxID=45954 RepID=UPI002263ACEF|nr:uncharacterized protein LOC127870084 [Dreissena polymorpha]
MEASKKVQEILGQMQKTLECSICLELMTNPVSTSCGHQFCRFCLIEFLERKKQVPCPLCKKMITKRSLIEREQLGEMVLGVKSLIAAFQKDTGVLFSPLRGPQPSVLPGSPDVIRAKTALDKRKTNVRSTKLKAKAAETTSCPPEEIHPSSDRQQQLLDLIESGNFDARNDSVPKIKAGAMKLKIQPASKAKGKASLVASGDIKEKNEGEHLKRNNEDENIQQTDTTDCEGISPRQLSNDTRESKKNKDMYYVAKRLSESASTDVIEESFGQDNEKNGKVHEKSSKNGEHEEELHNLELGKISLKELDKKAIDNHIEMNTDNDILSSASFSINSSQSTGPLFKTPVEIVTKKGKGKISKAAIEFVTNRQSSRSNSKKSNALGESGLHEIDTKLTPDVDMELAHGNDIQRTYSRKGKSLPKESRKSVEKVFEWLNNVEESKTEKLVVESVLDDKKSGTIATTGKRQSKKSRKLQEDEKAMGLKMKHLAKQVEETSKELLFAFDDFAERNEKEIDTIGEENVGRHNRLASESVELGKTEHVGTHVNNYLEMEGKDEAVKDTETDNYDSAEQQPKGSLMLSKDGQTFNQKLPKNVNDADEHNKTVDKNTTCLPKPSSEHTMNGNIAEQESKCENNGDVQVKKKKIFKTRTSTLNSDILRPPHVEGKNAIYTDVSSQVGKSKLLIDETTNFSPESDPYEFKSSQNTPNKPLEKKAGKRIKKTVQKKVPNNVKPRVVFAQPNKRNINEMNKMWNIDPGKRLPDQQNNENDINKITETISAAEEYNLLTCTREAINKLDTNGKTRNTSSTEPNNTKNSDIMLKKVRFQEPDLNNFVSSGKVDDLEKTKLEFQKSAKAKEYEEYLRKYIAAAGDVDDNSSDDISEDYRFQDDSSGTDDLEIVATPEQFEKPDLDLQPDKVKQKLSEQSLLEIDYEGSSLQTTQTKEQSNSENVDIVRATPALFTVPMFKTTFRKPLTGINTYESKKNENEKSTHQNTLSDEKLNHNKHEREPDKMVLSPRCKKNKVQISEQSKNGRKGTIAEAERLYQDLDVVAETPLITIVKTIPETPVDITEKEKCSGDKQQEENGIDELAEVHQESNENPIESDSDVTQTPSAENELQWQNNEQKSGKNKPGIEYYHDKENKRVIGGSSSTSTCTQNTDNSESLLKSTTSPARLVGQSAKKPEVIENLRNSNCEQTKHLVKEEEIGKIDKRDEKNSKQCVPVSSEDSVMSSFGSRGKQKRKRKCFMLDDKEDLLDQGSLILGKEANFEELENEQKFKRQRSYNNSPAEAEPESSVKCGTNTKNSQDSLKGSKTKIKESSVDMIADTCNSYFTGSLKGHAASVRREENVMNADKQPDDYNEIMNIPGSVDSQMSTVDPKYIEPDYETIQITAHTSKQKKHQRNHEISRDNLNEREHSQESTFVAQSSNSNVPSSNQVTQRENVQTDASQGSSCSGMDRSRHLSGLLMSPDSSFTYHGIQPSPDDIFCLDSEMPKIDQSPNAELTERIFLSPDSEGNSVYIEKVLEIKSSGQEKRKKKKDAHAVNEVIKSTKAQECKSWENGKSDNNYQLEQRKKVTNCQRQCEVIDMVDEVNDMDDNQNRARTQKSEVLGIKTLKEGHALDKLKYKAQKDKMLSPSLPKMSVPAEENVVEEVELLNFRPNRMRMEEENMVSPSTRIKSNLIQASKVTPGSKSTPASNVSPTSNDLNKIRTPIGGVSKYSPSVRKTHMNRVEGQFTKFGTLEPEVVDFDMKSDEKHKDKSTTKKDKSKYVISESHHKYVETNEKDNFGTDCFVDQNVTIVENKNYESQTCEQDDCMLSQDELPELDTVIFKRNVNEKELATRVTNKTKNESPHDMTPGKLQKRNTDHSVAARSKANYGDKLKRDNKRDEEYVDKVSDESDLNFDEDSVQENTERYVAKSKKDQHTKSDDNYSSTSSEFRLDSSDEEDDSVEKKALDTIAKFNEIKKSIEITSSSDVICLTQPCARNGVNSETKTKNDRKSKFLTDKKSSDTSKKTLESRQEDKKANSLHYSAKKYSTILDSSDSEIGSQPVVLESELEDEDDNVAGPVGVSEVDDKDDDDVVVHRKRVKRTIISDDSSDNDDDSSRMCNLTSSSAFSSQSEILNTQERESLERDLERLAREKKAIEERLRKKSMLKTQDKKTANIVSLQVDDSDDEMIDADDSDQDDDEDRMDLDFNHSPPTVTQQDSYQLSPPTHLASQDVQTVPDSDPSQPSRTPLLTLDPNSLNARGDNLACRKSNLGVVVTGLTATQIKETKKLASQMDVKFFTKFNNTVTHVVVKPVDDDDRLCERTLKFFHGIAHKCWIVSFFWVADSLQLGRLLHEGPYEIQGDTALGRLHSGPRKSRESKKRLFENINFMLIGENSSLSKESLTELILAAGGCVPSDLTLKGHGSRSICVACTDFDDEEGDEAVELQQQTRHKAAELKRRFGLVTVTREWVLDSLCLFEVQPVEEYSVTCT